MSEFEGNLVIINVGGTIFQTTFETLSKFPDTRLGSISKTSTNFNKETNQYFFDRSPVLFYEILDMYRTGYLHLPNTCCGATIENELEFWCIPKTKISECCLRTFHQYTSDMKIIKNLQKTLDGLEMDYNLTECETSNWRKVMREVWHLIENPKSSLLAKIYNVLYLMIVVISILSFMLGFQPEFRQGREDYNIQNLLQNPTYRRILLSNHIDLNNTKQMAFISTTPVDALLNIDKFCYFFFTLELVIHFLSCPKKLRFFTYFLNILDIYLVMIMWLTLALENNAESWVEEPEAVSFYMFIKSCVILRLLRFLRLVRQYNRLRILFMAIRASVQELFLLFVTFLLASTFFASFMYFAEFDVASTFPTIFSGIWWAVVTMTTVGYGDMVPKSTYGYFVGALCAFFGILILAMPIAIVATNFSDYTQKNNERELKRKFTSSPSSIYKCCRRRHSSKVDMVKDKKDKDTVM